MITYLLRACEITERVAATEQIRRVLFTKGRVRAFNGVLEYQAPSSLDADETFALSEKRLISALHASSEGAEIKTTKEYFLLKNGPLSLRVRKLDAEGAYYERIKMSPKAKTQLCGNLLEAMRKAQPFMSTDASRGWSVSMYVHKGYLWATNNLSIVRVKLESNIPEGTKIPLLAVNTLCELPSLDHWDIDERKNLIFSCGKELFRTPQHDGEWPDIARFFAKYPKKIAPVPEEMKLAAKTIEKFSERFVSMDMKGVSTTSASLDAEYEVAFEKGAGLYNASLLSLILNVATHADFSFYPDPVVFKGDGIEGVAVGALKPPAEEGKR